MLRQHAVRLVERCCLRQSALRGTEHQSHWVVFGTALRHDLQVVTLWPQVIERPQLEERLLLDEQQYLATYSVRGIPCIGYLAASQVCHQLEAVYEQVREEDRILQRFIDSLLDLGGTDE